MNRDDRAALVEMGRQFTPGLFEGLDATSPDELVLGQMGNALSFLHALALEAAAEPGKAPPLTGSTDDAGLDDEPTYAEVEAWLEWQTLTVQRQRMQLVEQPGGHRRRVYSATQEPASMADVLSWRLNDQGGLHLVLSDGQAPCLPWP